MRILWIIMLCGLLCACDNFRTYIVRGNVEGIDNGIYIYLCRVDGCNTVVDSAIVVDGQFEFSGEADTLPCWMILKLKNRFTAVSSLFIEPGIITVKGTLNNATATGTFNNNVQADYNKRIAPMYDQHYRMNFAMTQITDDTDRDSLKLIFDAYSTRMLSDQLSFIKEYPSSLTAVSTASYISRKMSSKEIENVLSLLDLSVSEMSEVVEMRKRAEQLKKCEVGVIAPDFTLLGQDGNKITLTDLRGCWVLLDFWASWCAPCRAAFPSVAAIDRDYGPKGLVVIGVSLDKDEKAWRKALEEENCAWIQLHDEKGDVAKEYAILSIPDMILISPAGVIEARNLNKDELHSIVKKLFYI